MALEKLSIIIFTYNRYEFLERLLDYYRSFDLKCPIIVLDSSSDPITSDHLKQLLSQSTVIHQKFDPKLYLISRISQGLGLVQTPFAVLCADDDFIIPDALAQCVDFLEGHPDYACAHGLYINHLLTQKDHQFIWSSLNKKAFSLESDQALDRFEGFFPDGYDGLPFYALHRTEDLQAVWKQTESFVDSTFLGEIFPSCCTVLIGKMKILPIFYSSRETNALTWYNQDHRKVMFSADKIQRAVEGLVDIAYKRHGVNQAQARALFKSRFDLYLSRLMNPSKDKTFLAKLLYKVQRRVNDVVWVFNMGSHIPLFFKNLNIIKKSIQKLGFTGELFYRSRMNNFLSSKNEGLEVPKSHE